MLELDIRPGHGVGPFELGTSIWVVLDYLQQPANKTTFPQIDVKYDTSSPVNSSVLLHLKPHIDLLFSPLDQRLTLINLRRLRSPGQGLVIKYRDKVITLCRPVGSTGNEVTLRRPIVSQVFGPTYTGDTMRYPGVWFGFREDGVMNSSQIQHVVEERNQEVKRIVVIQKSGGESMTRERDILEEPIQCSEMDGELKTAKVSLDKPNGISTLSLTFYLPTSANTEQQAPVEIVLGKTTAQDLTAELGWPPRVYYKEDDRMKIHKAVSRSGVVALEEDDTNSYFLNYFQHGLDFLISGSTHTVQKFVMHSNVPGTYLFQRYKRCRWEISTSTNLPVTTFSPLIRDDHLPAIDEGTDNLDVIEPKRNRKGKVTRRNLSETPSPNIVALRVEDGDDSFGKTASPSARNVSLFDKIDVIKSVLSPSQDPRSVQPHRTQAGGGRPVMTLDRSSDSVNAEPLIGSTSQLIGFDNMVLEVSELGDVLCAIVF